MNRQKQFSTTSRNRLSDRDIMLDLLMTEKHLSSLYDHGVMEAASPMVSNTFERLQADTHDSIRAIFAAMQQRGWYNPEQEANKQRRSQSSPKQTGQSFNQTADSKYAVTSGSRKLGRHLPSGQRQGKSGIFTNRKPETQLEM